MSYMTESYEEIAAEYAKLTPDEQAAMDYEVRKEMAERKADRVFESKLFAYGLPTLFFGSVALSQAAIAAEAAAAEAAAAEAGFGATALELEAAWLAPEALPAIGETMGTPVVAAGPGLLDRAYNFLKDVGGTASSLMGLGKEVSKTFSPIFSPEYPTAADRTGAQEYTKLEKQGQLTSPAVPGFATDNDNNMLLLAGGVVLLILLTR